MSSLVVRNAAILSLFIPHDHLFCFRPLLVRLSQDELTRAYEFVPVGCFIFLRFYIYLPSVRGHVEARGQLVRVRLLQRCAAEVLNSGDYAWQQAPLHGKPCDPPAGGFLAGVKVHDPVLSRCRGIF